MVDYLIGGWLTEEPKPLHLNKGVDKMIVICCPIDKMNYQQPNKHDKREIENLIKFKKRLKKDLTNKSFDDILNTELRKRS